MKWLPALLLCVVIVLIIAVLYCVTTYFAAKIEVRGRPRKPAFFCSKHGFISGELTIKFLEIDYCPICYNENLTKAEQI